MRYLPISLNTQNAQIALIGNGEAALNKLRLLIKTSAQINLFAAHPSLELATFLIQQTHKNINHSHLTFNQADLKHVAAVFACSDDQTENLQIAKWSLAKNIPFNSPDKPEICTFIVPSIVDRSPVTIAISTEGAAPVLAKQIRAHIEQYLPQNIGNLATFAQNLRNKVQSKLTKSSDRRYFWENFFNGNIASHYLNGNAKTVDNLIATALEAPHQHDGKIYVIHAAAPDMLSIKAARTLQLADYIYQLHGDIVDIEDFNHYARRDAHFVQISSNPNKPEDGELIMQIAKQARNGKLIVVIGDSSTDKRKSKISNHLFGKKINVEHLNAAQSNVEPNHQFSQTQF